MEQQQTLVIGDIHGQLRELEEMIAMVPDGTKIISCGDLVDRGPSSKEVVDFCIDNNVQVCLGNHEAMVIDAARNIPMIWDSHWFDNGGKEVYDTYETEEEFLRHVEFFKSLPVYINTGHKIGEREVIASHTYILDMVDPDVPDGLASISQGMKWPLLWSRTRPASEKRQAWVNIHGHTPTDIYAKLTHVPFFSKSSINLDTGCCYDSKGRGYLTGILLPSQNIIQIKRKT